MKKEMIGSLDNAANEAAIYVPDKSIKKMIRDTHSNPGVQS